MKVQDILDIAKYKLSNVAISKNDTALIKFTYLGVSELYRRFNLSIKSETIQVNSNLALYELRNTDVSLLLTLFNQSGRELKQTDVSNALNFDYKLVNYRSFILNKPFDGLIYALYKASPVVFKDGDDIIDLPDAMFQALIDYVTYYCHSTVNTDNANESTIDYQKFNADCAELENQGFKIPLNTETMSMRFKGFV